MIPQSHTECLATERNFCVEIKYTAQVQCPGSQSANNFIFELLAKGSHQFHSIQEISMVRHDSRIIHLRSGSIIWDVNQIRSDYHSVHIMRCEPNDAFRPSISKGMRKKFQNE